jgi:two-component system response regulator FixJ
MSSDSEVVLVVDDDAAVRGALKFALEVEGFRVRLYPGSEALLADENLPVRGCLVIDYRMPDIDGLELVERLKGRGVTLPIFLISGRMTRDLKDRALRLGVLKVFEKPLTDLIANVRHLLHDGA